MGSLYQGCLPTKPTGQKYYCRYITWGTIVEAVEPRFLGRLFLQVTTDPNLASVTLDHNSNHNLGLLPRITNVRTN